jgi:hypothetical protein
MTVAEVLQALAHLNNKERMTIAQAALSLMRQEWQALTPEQKEQQLATSAELAVLDYLPGSELTAFTALDGEEFHGYSDEETPTDVNAHA